MKQATKYRTGWRWKGGMKFGWRKLHVPYESQVSLQKKQREKLRGLAGVQGFMAEQSVRRVTSANLSKCRVSVQ